MEKKELNFRRCGLPGIIFFSVFLIDQLSKYFATKSGVVSINTGVSFSLGSGVETGILVLLAFVVLAILALRVRQYSFRYKWEVFAILSSASLSNVFDRIRLGGVQDFLPIPILNVHNNLADWAIAGALLVVLWEELQLRD